MSLVGAMGYYGKGSDGSGDGLVETSVAASTLKGKFDASAGKKLLWNKIKFVAYPTATECKHESHDLVMSYYGIKPEDKGESGCSMRTYFKHIVSGLNEQRNSSIRESRKLFVGKCYWSSLVGLVVQLFTNSLCGSFKRK
jgi:hypothetical protein